MLEVRLSQQRVLEDHWRRRRIPVVLSIGGGGDMGLWSSHRACPCHGSPTRSIRDLAASPRDSPPAALRTQKPGLRVARLPRRPPASSSAHTPSASPPRGLHTPRWPRTPRAAVRSPCPHHTSPTHLEGLGLCPCWCPADHRPLPARGAGRCSPSLAKPVRSSASGGCTCRGAVGAPSARPPPLSPRPWSTMVRPCALQLTMLHT